MTVFRCIDRTTHARNHRLFSAVHPRKPDSSPRCRDRREAERSDHPIRVFLSLLIAVGCQSHIYRAHVTVGSRDQQQTGYSVDDPNAVRRLLDTVPGAGTGNFTDVHWPSDPNIEVMFLYSNGKEINVVRSDGQTWTDISGHTGDAQALVAEVKNIVASATPTSTTRP